MVISSIGPEHPLGKSALGQISFCPILCHWPPEGSWRSEKRWFCLLMVEKKGAAESQSPSVHFPLSLFTFPSASVHYLHCHCQHQERLDIDSCPVTHTCTCLQTHTKNRHTHPLPFIHPHPHTDSHADIHSHTNTYTCTAVISWLIFFSPALDVHFYFTLPVQKNMMHLGLPMLQTGLKKSNYTTITCPLPQCYFSHTQPLFWKPQRR